MTALEVTISLTNDSSDDVAQKSSKVLIAGRKLLENDYLENERFWEVLEERLFALATKLPTTARLQGYYQQFIL